MIVISIIKVINKNKPYLLLLRKLQTLSNSVKNKAVNMNFDYLDLF